MCGSCILAVVVAGVEIVEEETLRQGSGILHFQSLVQILTKFVADATTRANIPPYLFIQLVVDFCVDFREKPAEVVLSGLGSNKGQVRKKSVGVV